MFLGFAANVANFDAKAQSFVLVLEENPLLEFVELPPHLKEKLLYNNIICGVLRGALEMVRNYGLAHFLISRSKCEWSARKRKVHCVVMR